MSEQRKPWTENAYVYHYDAAFQAWIESGEESADLARRFILGDTALTDERARVNIARLAFFCGRRDGCAFVLGEQMQWAQQPAAGGAA